MNAELSFSLLNLFILPGWLLLIFAPRWRVTERLVISGLYSLAYAVIYVVLIVSSIGEVSLDFGSLQAVSNLFGNTNILLAGWVHYLAFDLLIGSSIVKDSQARKIPHWWTVPVLFFTFYLGPAGYLLSRVNRYVYTRVFLKQQAEL